MLKQAFKQWPETVFDWFVLQPILPFNLFSVYPWQFLQKMTGLGIGSPWKTWSLSTQQITLDMLVILLHTERTLSTLCWCPNISYRQRLPSLHTLLILLFMHMQGRSCYMIQHSSSKKAWARFPWHILQGILDTAQCKQPQQLSTAVSLCQVRLSHQLKLICMQNGVLKLVPAGHVAEGGLFVLKYCGGVSWSLALIQRAFCLPACRVWGSEESWRQPRLSAAKWAGSGLIGSE